MIAKRLRTRAVEIAHWAEYDYVVVNNDLDHCFNEIRSILEAERRKRARNPAIGELAETLASELSNVLL